MARPTKNTVDYFPHIIQNGKTMFILESKYGNNGYAFWFKLLELLGSTDNQVYDYNNPSDWQFLLAKTKVTEEIAVDILKTLSEVGAIDKELLGNKVIWSDNFIKNIADVYKRRKQQIPSKPIISNKNPIIVDNNSITSSNNPQSKVKYIKVNKIKTKENTKVVFDFTLKTFSNLLEEDKKLWAEAYPACNIELELKRMATWIVANPRKGKKSNYERFITSWLSRSQDSGGTKGVTNGSSASKGFTKEYPTGKVINTDN